MGLSDGAFRQLVHRARLTLRAAATAITPFPVASWAAAAGGRLRPQEMAIIRSIGSLALAAMSSGTLTTSRMARRESRRPGSVIIFM